MKRCFQLALVGAWVQLAAAQEPAPPVLRYAVAFKGDVVATQSVSIVHGAGSTTISCSFAADLPVFVATHRYSEELSVTYRPADGTVERFEAVLQDGPIRTEISADVQDAEGGLEVVRTDPSGTSIHVIRRADYDFHSLAMYGRTPADFLPTNSPARVLSIAQGEVRPVLVQSNMESDTFERQHLETTHLVWTDGPHVSHSWHPERFSNLPRRYIRQTDAGEFVFNLIR